jgi:hypothetical protein
LPSHQAILEPCDTFLDSEDDTALFPGFTL